MYDRLLEWKNREHKCLTIKGQRQVGKTYIIDSFGRKEYSHYVYIDLNVDDPAREVFEKKTAVDEIIKSLEVIADTEIPEGSLIFLDEIQECPRARMLLKQFTIDGRYDVISSGSLLGINNAKLKGKELLLPMGYEEHMTMYGLDFEEFLWAAGVKEEYIEEVRADIRGKRPIMNALYDKFSMLFRDFMIVGGMPASVDSYVRTGKFNGSFAVLDRIIETCRNDINRYNTDSNVVKTTQCFDSIAPQLAETNKKFTYTRIEGDQSRRAFGKYMENILWIKYAGYGNFCYLLDTVEMPLKSHLMPDVFKIYLSDTGMLLRMYGMDTARAIFLGNTEFNNGAIVENEIAECLMKAGIEPMFHRKNNSPKKMELDFVTEYDMKPAVIEVRSGKDRDYPSLEKAKKIFDIGRSIKLEEENISVDEDGTEHYPLFVAGFVRDIIPRCDF